MDGDAGSVGDAFTAGERFCSTPVEHSCGVRFGVLVGTM